MLNGGASRDRTDDPLLAKQVLSQLSYGPIACLFSAWLRLLLIYFGHLPIRKLPRALAIYLANQKILVAIPLHNSPDPTI